MRRYAPALLALLLILQLTLLAPAAPDGAGTATEAPIAPLAGTSFSHLGGEDEAVTFTNVSRQAGLDAFSGNYFAWGDYDGDGHQDLLVNGRKLLRNSGPPSWTFSDVTAQVGLDQTSRVNVGIWGDYDNDGDLDVYLAGGGWSESNPTRSDYLFRNNGPPDWNFTDVTSDAGGVVDDYPSVAAAWGDLDGDGLLDLYVANYENSEMTSYWPDTLWHNAGGGTFTDVSTSWGIRSVAAAPGRGVAFCDYDDDGDADIHVSNYRLKANFLWRNDGSGRLSDVAASAGVTGDANYYQTQGPYYGHTIGASWADWNNDGLMDLWEANLVHKYVGPIPGGGYDIRGEICDDSKFYVNNGDGTFLDVRPSTGIQYKPKGGQGVYVGDELYDGIAWADFDNDGDLDVFMPQVYNLDYAYSYLYLNLGDGTFLDVGTYYGVRVWNTYGAAWADYDNDGDLDLVTGGMSPRGAPSRIHLFSNGGNSNGWLKVEVEGTTSNRMGLGTRVTVVAGNTTMTRDVEGGTGSHAQMNDLPVEFGMGRATQADTVVVRFPSGAEMAFLDVPVNTTLVVREVASGGQAELDADPVLPFEDQDVTLSTTAVAATTGEYTGYYWDVDGDGGFDVRTSGRSLTHSWSARGIYRPRVGVARDQEGTSFVQLSPSVEIDVRNALPVAVAGPDVTVGEDEVLVLDGSASTDTPSDLPTLEYRWVVDGLDNGWSGDPTLNVSWPTPATHAAILYVRDDDGSLATDDLRITVENVPPEVADPGDMEAWEDREVLIETTATDSPSDLPGLVYRINFGDGNTTGWIAEPRHLYTYRVSGVMEVRVDARDEDGAIGSAHFNIIVHNEVPYVELSLKVDEVEEDEPFEAFGVIADSYSDSETLLWRFDFGDGNGTDWRRKPVQRVSHSYARSGTFTVSLVVMDDDLAVNASSRDVRVVNLQPSVTMSAVSTVVDEDALVELTAVGSDTPSDQARLMYRWEMGDGTIKPWTMETVALHSYHRAGSYMVEVTVRDDDGDTSSTKLPIRVSNQPPRAEIVASSISVKEGESVVLDASTSSDTPSDLPNLTYTWNIGGVIREGMTITFNWSESGRHNVILTVRDEDGAIGERTLQVAVVNVRPDGMATVDRTEARAGELLTFIAVDLEDTPGDLLTLTVTWTMGDGTLLTGTSVTHRYREGGTYTVTMIVRDDDGDSVERIVTVTIEEDEVGLMSGTGGILVVIVVLVGLAALVGIYMLHRRSEMAKESAKAVAPEEVGEGARAEDDEDVGPDTMETLNNRQGQ